LNKFVGELKGLADGTVERWNAEDVVGVVEKLKDEGAGAGAGVGVVEKLKDEGAGVDVVAGVSVNVGAGVGVGVGAEVVASAGVSGAVGGEIFGVGSTGRGARGGSSVAFLKRRIVNESYAITLFTMTNASTESRIGIVQPGTVNVFVQSVAMITFTSSVSP